MVRSLVWHALAAAAFALASASTARADDLCALVPNSYSSAKQTYPDAAFALAELEKHSIATWYSDRNGEYAATLRELANTCPESSRLNLVVYGIPNKDCETGYSSSSGTVKTAADYLKFLTDLTGVVGNRKALYVLEPDAVGLLAKDGGCGEAAGYRENLKTAIKQLSTNSNADIYLDVGYWTLQYSDSLSRVAAIVKELAEVGKIKGITINTSNYRSNAELSALCSAFQVVMGSTAYGCAVDTSRNYNAPTSTEWCNVKTAGIGRPPTSETGYSNLDYFMWVKPPGESDGQCNGGDHTSESLQGPDAGRFFEKGFELLWNQGYFTKELGMPAIGGSGAVPTPAPVTSKPQTPAPRSTSPVQQYSTPAPATESPIMVTPDLLTPAPTAASPIPITVTPDLPTPVPAPAPATESPIPLPTPTSTPCVYRMAGGDNTNQRATSSPTQPVLLPVTTPASTATAASDSSTYATPFPTTSIPPTASPTSSPAGSESGNGLDTTDVDANSNAIELPTPAPTKSLRDETNDIAVNHESSSHGDTKQVSTESSSGSTGATAGILAVVLIIALVAAIAMYMNSQAKKKQLEEPKESPAMLATTTRAGEPQASYLSAL